MIFRGNLTSNSSNTNISSSNNKKTTTPSDLKLSHNNLTMESAASVPFSQSSPKSPHTMATTCGFSPNVTTKSCVATDDRDAQIKSLQGEVVSLKDVIKSRDAEIIKLRREIHKLKVNIYQ